MLSTRLFTADDVSVGMRLKTQAGWNQLPADWERMLALQPDGCFVAVEQGMPVGTVMTCVFGGVGWIAMMLVDEKLRGRGIGRSLMERALAFLEGQNVRSVRLDATPLGQTLYEKLGFAPQYALARYAGIPQSSMPPDEIASVIPAATVHHEAIFALDRAVTKTDRRKLISRLLAEHPGFVAARGADLAGFLLWRPGSQAAQIGPCIAADWAGIPLLNYAFSRLADRQVYIDIPCSHSPAAALARQHGLVVQRELLRMCRGELVCEDDRLWSSSGPELG